MNIYLSVDFDHGLSMTGVDFVPAESAKSNPKTQKSQSLTMPMKVKMTLKW